MTREGEPTANRGVKLRIYPTKEQERKIRHNMCISKAAYNFAVWKNLQEYEAYMKAKEDFKQSLSGELSEEQRTKAIKEFEGTEYKKYIHSPRDLSVLFTQECKSNLQYSWFGDYDSNARCGTFEVKYSSALKHFRENIQESIKRVREEKKKNPKKVFRYPYHYGFPKFKKEADSYPTVIYVTKLYERKGYIFLPKIGFVKLAPNQQIPVFQFPSIKLVRPSVATDGEGYYLSFGYYKEYEDLEIPKSEVLGVDLGIKNLAILSNGVTVPNLANDKKVIRYNNKIQALQKELSKLIDGGKSVKFRPYIITKEELEAIPKNLRGKKLAELSKERNKLKSCKTEKIKKSVKKLYAKMNRYREYQMHNMCHQIISANPEGLIFENLNVKGMQKNSKVSSKLQKTGMSDFKDKLTWHATKHNIPVKKVSQWYASSQICSNCGYQNKEMKDLSKRAFVCPECGYTADRDINASINLKKMWNELK